MVDYSSDNAKRKLLILDDLMRESSSDVILDLFTKGSHHNISVIFVAQNVFLKGKAQRDISLNTKYLVLLKTRATERKYSTSRDKYFRKIRLFRAGPI